MEKKSKRYRSALQVADLTKEYPLKEAVEILAKFPKAKFDETVELAFRLGVDASQGDQMVRGTTPLPNGTGKKVRVLVFTDNPKAALDAGADYAGLQDLMQKIQEGWLDFDVAIATTEAMKTVRTIARVLGPKGLMPNPKSGTVTDDIPAGIKAVKAGRVEFKMDKAANIGVGIGKRSFTPAPDSRKRRRRARGRRQGQARLLQGPLHPHHGAFLNPKPRHPHRGQRIQQILNRSASHES